MIGRYNNFIAIGKNQTGLTGLLFHQHNVACLVEYNELDERHQIAVPSPLTISTSTYCASHPTLPNELGSLKECRVGGGEI